VPPVTQKPTGVPGLTGILKFAIGMAVGAVFVVTAIVAVPACTHPFAVVTLGVVCPVGNTPPMRYHNSALIVPVLKVFDTPVTSIDDEVVISNVIAVEPLLAESGGMVEMVVCAKTVVNNKTARAVRPSCNRDFIICRVLDTSKSRLQNDCLLFSC